MKVATQVVDGSLLQTIAVYLNEKPHSDTSAGILRASLNAKENVQPLEAVLEIDRKTHAATHEKALKELREKHKAELEQKQAELDEVRQRLEKLEPRSMPAPREG